MTPERFARLRATLECRQTTLTVLMENVHKPHNYAAVIRTCDAVGVHQAHAIATELLVSQRPVASVSAERYVHVHVHDNIESSVTHLKKQGMRILAAHLSQTAIPFVDVDYTEPVAILLGAEKEGVSPKAAELADEHIMIPMHGLVASLNVSVAAAVILYEAQRQRYAAGFYNRRWLPDAQYHQLLFEWAHPKIAAYCRRHNRAYPALSDTGDIIEEFRCPH